mmetsp:Transcript_92738/g.299980  ORF Transcript_92738/g.299980 Transcript_92738/m.299980 type:complete len:122 (-) Transcript_92738:423-788(-)
MPFALQHHAAFRAGHRGIWPAWQSKEGPEADACSQPTYMCSQHHRFLPEGQERILTTSEVVFTMQWYGPFGSSAGAGSGACLAAAAPREEFAPGSGAGAGACGRAECEVGAVAIRGLMAMA